VGSTAPPSGPVTVNAPVVAVLLADTGLNITNLRTSDVSAAYGFLPVGAKVTYTGAGVPDIVATRTGPGFTLAPAPTAANTYTSAKFTLEANADHGIAVRCAVAPRVGDCLGLGTAFAPIANVVPTGGDTYVLQFAPGTAVSDQAQIRFGVFSVENATVVASRFAINVSVDGVLTEQFTGRSLSDGHPQYYAKDDVITGTSALITVSPRAAGAPGVSLSATPFYVTADRIGADKAPANDDFRQGLTRLEEQQEPAMVICPDALTIDDPLLQA